MADEPSRPWGLVSRMQLIRAAAVDARLSRSDLAVLIVILDRINDETGDAWPSQRKIQADTGCSKSSVERALDRLVALGYVGRTSGDRKTSNRYRMGTPINEGTPMHEGTPTGEGWVPPPVRLEVPPPVKDELAYKSNLPKEPGEPAEESAGSTPAAQVSGAEQDSTSAASKRRKKRMLTYVEWVESVPEDQMLIPTGHPVFEYAKNAGIPREFLNLAWSAFGRRYCENPKRYKDWPRVFQNAIQGDWLKVWRYDHGAGQYVLTTLGLQEQHAVRREDQAA